MSPLWRKHILPFGTLEYGKGDYSHPPRKLNFTPDYLAEIVASFNAKARELVAFTAEAAGGGLINDPERISGVVRNIEIVDDGVDAIIEVNATVDALLAKNTNEAVGVRLVENYYNDTQKITYRVVLAGVYFARSPLLTLRPWVREPIPTFSDAANELNVAINKALLSDLPWSDPNANVEDEVRDRMRKIVESGDGPFDER
jgi:hypothetical protein